MTTTKNDVYPAAYISELEDKIDQLQAELYEALNYNSHAEQLADLHGAASDVIDGAYSSAEIELVTPARHGLGYLVTLRVDASPGQAALDYRPGRKVTLSSADPSAFSALSASL